jgi:hypothetical protein
MHENLNISANSNPKSKIHLMVIQELRWVLLAKPVSNEKSHGSVPLTRPC